MKEHELPWPVRSILGVGVHRTDYESSARVILQRSLTGLGGYVCAAPVHLIMEAFDRRDFRNIVNNAYIVTPDGMPLVWALKLLGEKQSTRVYGPTLTLHVCRAAEHAGIPVGFFGGTEMLLARLKARLREQFPSLKIVYAYSPPMQTDIEPVSEGVQDQIIASGAKILFVGLGCPKQEKWMALHEQRLPLVLLGVGAAFDFISGSKPQAPAWMQRAGLEWAFRFMSEPRRLWRRYLYNNPRFILHFGLQLLRQSRNQQAR